MQFLKQQNKRVDGRDPLAHANLESNTWYEDILAAGKNVVVIGGGDTGSDCVGTSNRQGAASVTQFELLPQPPTDRTAAMPWPSYPMLLKTTSSHEEGCERKWAVGTKAFLKDDNGNLKAIRLVDLEWKSGADGRPASFTEVAGSERDIPCELALLAMGFLHPQYEGLLEQLEIERDERGNVKASEKNYQTSLPKIFVAGDARRGQSLVVWAISEGREAARKVDEFLNNGSSALETRDASILHAFA
jgi:glutamate synthase (NADPH/NADH) small chain